MNEHHAALLQVVAQTQLLKSSLQQCAWELRGANTAIRLEIGQETTMALHRAIRTSERVQMCIQDGSDRLSAINDALDGRFRDHILLDYQLAAAVEQHEAARRASLHDPLTDLPNRALLVDRLEHGLAQAKRHQWKLAVLFMDLDSFKRVNDQYGHDIGDHVLQQVAHRIASNIRGEDTVSRYGGDEFLYVVTGIQDDQCVTRIAEKMIATIREPNEVLVGGEIVHLIVEASVGIALYPADGTTAETLLKCADRAMYRAKTDGNTHVFA